MLPIFAGVGVLAGSTLVLQAGSRWRRKRLNAAWALVADELGVSVTSVDRTVAAPKLRGEVDGLTIAVTGAREWRGDPRRYGAPVARWRYEQSADPRRYEVWFPWTGPRGVVGKGDTVNDPDLVTVGDVAFDSRIPITSYEHDEWRAYLTLERRRAILAIFGHCGNVRIENGRITVYDALQNTSTTDLATRVRFLVEQAHVLSGRVMAAEVAPAPATGDDIDAVPSDQIEGADWSLDDVVGWDSVAVPVVEAAHGPGPMSQLVSAADAVQHLFGSGVVDVDARFDAYWSGRRVSWSGKVVSAMPFLDGELPKATIVVTIGHIDGMQLISNQVDAVVDVSGHPAARGGQRFSFTGTLSKVDHFARKFYVNDAQAT